MTMFQQQLIPKLGMSNSAFSSICCGVKMASPTSIW